MKGGGSDDGAMSDPGLRRVRDGLPSGASANGETRALWILRGLAVLFSLALWLYFSFLPRIEDRSEPRISSSVLATLGFEAPDNYMILNADDQTVTVKVRGRSDLVRSLTPEEVDIQVPFPSDFEPNTPTDVILRPEDVSLPDDLEIESLTPNRLTLLIDEKHSLSLAVRPTYVGEPSARATVMQDLTTVTPNRVTVEGPRALLEKLEAVETNRINLANHAISFRTQVGVAPPDANVRILHPTLVEVHVVFDVPDTIGVPGRGGG